jgi:hypothetical protein
MKTPHASDLGTAYGGAAARLAQTRTGLPDEHRTRRAVSATEDLFRGNSFQHLAFAYTEHVLALAAEGAFAGASLDDGRVISASNLILIMLYFAHHTARNTDLDKGRKAGCVLEGKATQKAIMKETGLSEKTIQRAIKWLDERAFIDVHYIHEGKKQYYGSIQVLSWSADSEAVRKEWWASQQATQNVSEPAFPGNQSPGPVVPVPGTGSTSPQDRVFNTSSYNQEPTKSDDTGQTASGSKRTKPAARHGNDDQPLEDTDDWFEDFKARMVPDLEQPEDRDDLVTFFVGKSRSGTPYLAMEGSRSKEHPHGRNFVPGMDEGQIRLTPEQVSEYFKARHTDQRRWRHLNHEYYDLAMDTDPGFRRRPPKRTVAERGREYNNLFWVQTEGERAGYFTRTHLADQQPGEVRVELTPREAKELFDMADRTRQVAFMQKKIGHAEEAA